MSKEESDARMANAIVEKIVSPSMQILNSLRLQTNKFFETTKFDLDGILFSREETPGEEETVDPVVRKPPKPRRNRADEPAIF